MAEFTSGASWSDPGRDPLEDLQRAKELAEEQYDQGLAPEYEPISRGMLRRVRAWFSSRLQAFDESHVVDLGDADDVPEMVCVIEDAGPHPDTEVPPIRYHLGDPDVVELGAWRERFRANLLANPSPAAVSCAFCPERATEEIFVGWEWAKDHGHGPDAAVVEARFARVCINHVGHSRFTRSDRPVDEL